MLSSTSTISSCWPSWLEVLPFSSYNLRVLVSIGLDDNCLLYAPFSSNMPIKKNVLSILIGSTLVFLHFLIYSSLSRFFFQVCACTKVQSWEYHQGFRILIVHYPMVVWIRNVVKKTRNKLIFSLNSHYWIYILCMIIMIHKSQERV